MSAGKERLAFSDALIRQLRDVQAEQARAEFPDSFAVENDAVIACSFLTTTYITLDGRILQLDLVEKDAVPMVLVEPNDICRALTVAAKSFQLQELLDLLPPRPDSGVDCPQCETRRWIQVGDQEPEKPGTVVCPRCCGLGWIQGASD